METKIIFENDKRRKHSHGKNHNHLLGIVLVIVGAALILKNIGIFPYPVRNIIFNWQMLLVVIGLVMTLGSSDDKTGGVIVMAIGAFFLIPKIYRYAFDVNIFWPAILIVVGLIIIFSRRVKVKGHSEAKIGDNFIDIINIFSGSERQIMSDNFSGGKITSIFGGSDIDLTQAKLAQGVSELEILCVFGGVTLVVPNDWNIKVDVLPVLGGFDERKIIANRSFDPSKQLVIKGVVVFGGGEIKSY